VNTGHSERIGRLLEQMLDKADNGTDGGADPAQQFSL